MAKKIDKDLLQAASSPLPDTKMQVFEESLENKKIEDWFTQVTNDIQSNIVRDQIKTSPQFATQMLSRFGFKRPNDLIVFLKSPAGKSVQAMIVEKLIEIKERNKMLASNQSEQKHEHMFAMLLLGLAYKKEAAAEMRLHRLNDEAIHERLEAGEEAIAEQAEQRYEESQQSLEESAWFYDESAEALEFTLDEQVEALESFESVLDEIEHFEANQDARENFFNDLFSNIDNIFNSEPEKQEKLTQNDRELVNSFKKGKIIEKENGVSYLLDAGQNLKDLNQEDKKGAQKAYMELKPAFNSLKKKVKQSHQEEQAQHAERKAHFMNQAPRIHQDITFLTQQLTELHTVRHEIQAQLEAKQEKNKLDPAIQVKKALQAELKPTLALMRSIKLMNRKLRAEDPVAELSSSNRLGEAHYLAESHRIGQGGPIPGDLTLRSLLQQANTLGAVITKAPTAEVSERQRERLYPDPKPRPESKAKSKAEPEETKSSAPSPFSTKNQPK